MMFNHGIIILKNNNSSSNDDDNNHNNHNNIATEQPVRILSLGLRSSALKLDMILQGRHHNPGETLESTETRQQLEMT